MTDSERTFWAKEIVYSAHRSPDGFEGGARFFRRYRRHEFSVAELGAITATARVMFDIYEMSGEQL